MKAITVYQPWASLIAYELKPFEFRKWPAPKRCINQRIAIHAGARAVDLDEVRDLIRKVDNDEPGTAMKKEGVLDFLERVLVSPGMVPRSAVVCTAFIGRARKATEMFGRQVADSDRIDQHIWAWPLTNVERIEPPEPASGMQGFWNWTPSSPCRSTTAV